MEDPQELSMKKVLLLVLVLMISLPVWARKPAVDPIMGISIDNEPRVKEPSLSTGFKFDSYQEVKRAPQSVETVAPAQLPPSQSKPDRTTPLFFMTLMLLLPIGLWFGIMKNIKGADEEEASPSNVKEFKREDKKDHKDDFKKAS